MWPIAYVMHLIKRLATLEITALVIFVGLIYVIKIGMLWSRDALFG